MNILYLSEDYYYTKVHHNLVESLVNSKQSKEDEFTIFTLFRENTSAKNLKDLYSNKSYKLLSVKNESNLLCYKYNFFYKIRYKYKVLLENSNIKNFDLIYASTLFSEGAIAYKAFKKHGIPYILAVRGTDISLYFSKMIHLWPLGLKILKNASKVLFISPSLKRNLLGMCSLIFLNKESLNNKSYIVPNGINDFWLKNSLLVRENKNSFVFIFIGRFDKNKNIKRVIKAFIKLTSIDSRKFELKLIGGGGYYSEYVESIVKQTNNIFFLGPIYDNELLLKEIRTANVFIMASHSETFGLVYLEALSQGLPVIYTKNQGIDGLFVDKYIGEKVISNSTTSILNSMLKASMLYYEYDYINTLKKFSWGKIGEKVYNILRDTLNE